MKKGLILINGLHLPHPVLNAAVIWAKEHDAELQVIFMTAAREQNEGYGFPSDLDSAQMLMDEDDAIKSDAKLLASQLLLVRDVAATEDIPCHVTHLAEPPLTEIVRQTRSADLLVIEAPKEASSPLLGVTGFTMNELIAEAGCEVMELGR
jgi:hypothetical protein